MPNYCKNHAETIAKRRCFQCKAFVCADCQILARRHYFCGMECLERYLKADATSEVESLRVRSQGMARILKSAQTWGWLINVVLLAALLWAVASLHELSRRFEVLQSAKASSTETSPSANSKSSAGAISISQPADNAMVLTNRIDIAGEARDGQIVSLAINDRIRAVTLPKRGKFEFKEVPVSRGSHELIVRAIDVDGSVSSLQIIRFEYNNPTVAYLSRNFTRGSITEPKIALTFDGGYMANASEEILNVLKQNDLKCTFFLTGMFIEKYPDIVCRMATDGHEIGNHTWSHAHLTTFEDDQNHLTKETVNREFLQNELIWTASAFEATTGGKLAPYWRAPYGEHNLEIREWAAELGYRHIGWTRGRGWQYTMDTLDWVSDTTSSAYRSSEEILDKILKFGNGSEHGANGAVVVMHLGTLRNGDFPHRKLPDIIDGLQEQGYELVRVSELLR